MLLPTQIVHRLIDPDQCGDRGEVPSKKMLRLFKTTGAVGIVALSFAAVASAQTSNLPDETICRRAINSDRSGWVEGSFYTEEASRRGLTFRACDELNNPPARTDSGTSGPTHNPPASAAQRSEFDVLSYETAISTSFLAKFQEAAEELNITPAESRRVILTLSGNLRDLPRYRSVYEQLRNMGSMVLDTQGRAVSGPNPAPGERLVNQLMTLVKRHDIEHAVTVVITNMREESLIHRRYIAATFDIPTRMALLFDDKTRSEIELLSYETGLPTQFITEFEAAAQNLNVGPTQRLLKKLTGKLCELEWYGQSRHELNDIGASWLANDLGILMKAGDVQAATERVLKTMKEWNPDARRYSAQIFGIPESTVLIYDELQRLRKGTTGSGSP